MKSEKDKLKEFFESIKTMDDTRKLREFYALITTLFKKFEFDKPREIIAVWTTITLLVFKDQLEKTNEKAEIKEFINNALYCITEIQKDDKNDTA